MRISDWSSDVCSSDLCAASAVHLSIGWALCTQVAELDARDAYELSSRGPLVAHLVRHARSLLLSEYFDGIAPGSVHHGVRCEDVQALSFADASFDLITHTEVLEQDRKSTRLNSSH